MNYTKDEGKDFTPNDASQVEIQHYEGSVVNLPNRDFMKVPDESGAMKILPRKTKEELVCCMWTQIHGVDVHIKYCYGEVQFRMKIHLPGNPKPVWREFSPPNKALQGSCNSYVRLLALAFKYGGGEFKRELRYQAKKAIYELKKAKFEIYKQSHDFVRKANANEIRHKVKKQDDDWKHALAARDNQWLDQGKWRYDSWQKMSTIYCALPAAIPMFFFPIPSFPYLLAIPGFLPIPLTIAIRSLNDDCCWMWPLNGDCPVCLIYGPNLLTLIFEGINLAIYMVMGGSKEQGCPPIEGWANCVGDGEITQVTDEAIEDTYPSDIPPDQSDDGLNFDSEGVEPGYEPADTPAEENIHSAGSIPEASEVKVDGVKAKGEAVVEGYGDGGDGDEENIRLGESDAGNWMSSTIRKTNLAALKSKTQKTVKGNKARGSHRYTETFTDSVVQKRHSSHHQIPGHRSTPGWHAKNAGWIIESTVKGRRADKVDRWLHDISAAELEHEVSEARRAELQNMTPEKRKEAVRKAWLAIPARQRKLKLQTIERQKKIEEHFVAHNTDQRHTKVHSVLGINPFSRLHGPLPMGWHVGESVAGMRYYWNDSGAKQLSLPTAPYLHRLMSSDPKELNVTGSKLQQKIYEGTRSLSMLNGLLQNTTHRQQLMPSIPQVEGAPGAGDSSLPQPEPSSKAPLEKQPQKKRKSRGLGSRKEAFAELASKANFVPRL